MHGHVKVFAAEAEQANVASEIDSVYSEIAELRDEIKGSKQEIQDALGEVLDLHSQCQQLERHNVTLARRLSKLTVSDE